MNELGTLLDDVEQFLWRYVVLTDEQASAITLWVVHTHAIDALEITPYLAITSATKQSGKTQLLEVLELLVARPWLTGSVSAATLARKIHGQRSTLLLDESDAAFKGDQDYAETLRGVLNSGFKRSGTYSRCVGSNGTSLNVEDFSTFSAKAIAGIGKLPDTVADRSIAIRLKRKNSHERIERKRERKVQAEAAPLRARIVAWAEQNADRVAELDHAPLEELSDRAADIWEPLLAIAYLAGDGKTSERWLIRARKAAVALSARQPDEEEASIRLLADVRAIFDRLNGDHVFSTTLVEELHAIEDAPWSEWHGKPISKNALARILRRYDIRPREIRIGSTTSRGYRRLDFEDDWNRYLAPLPPSTTETTETTAWLSEESALFNRNTKTERFGCEMPANPHEHKDVSVVSVEMGGTGGQGDECILCRAKFDRSHRMAELSRCANCVRRSLGIPVAA